MTLHSGKQYVFTREGDMKIILMKLDLEQFSTGFRWVNFIYDDSGSGWRYITVPKFNKLGLKMVGEL